MLPLIFVPLLPMMGAGAFGAQVKRGRATVSSFKERQRMDCYFERERLNALAEKYGLQKPFTSTY